MGDIVQKVLTVYKADTSDAKAALRGLRGEEANAAKARLTELDTQNKGIESQIAMWGKVAVGVGLAVGAYKAAQAAANAYLEDLRLESAAAGADIDKLRIATAGLVENDNLLAFAGKAMHGVWKLNQQEMETVLRGATALRKTMGVELQPTVEALTEAVSKGSTRALKEFGIEAKDKQDVLRQLGELYAKTGGDVALAGDDFLASNTKIADSFDDISSSFGELVLAMQPMIAIIADLTKGLAYFIQNFGSIIKGRENSLFLKGVGVQGVIDKYAGEKRLQELLAKGDDLAAKDAARDAEIAAYIANAPKLKAPKKPGAKRRGAGFDFDAAESKHEYSGTGEIMRDQGIFSDEAIQEHADAYALLWEKAHPPEIAKSQEMTIFESVFGTPEQMDDYSARLSVLSHGLTFMRDAAQSAFEVWYDNEGSIIQSIQNIAKQMLKSIAMELWANAIKNFALALSNWYNPPAAAAFALAGAKSAAGAIAIGVAAQHTGMSGGGGGGGAQSSAGGQSAGGYVSGGGSQPVDKSITIVLDDAWYGRTRTERAADMARAINQAKRGTSHIRRR